MAGCLLASCVSADIDPSGYTRYLKNEGVTLNGIVVKGSATEGLYLEAGRALEKGETVVEVEARSIVGPTSGGGIDFDGRKEVTTWLDELKKMDSTLVEGGEREVALAVRLITRGGVMHDVMAAKVPVSGANVTSAEIITCLYSDVRLHIDMLATKLSVFSDGAAQIGLGNPALNYRALLYALQNGATLPTSQDFVLFPAIELVTPSADGALQPGRLIDTDGKDIRLGAANKDDARRSLGKATFVVNRDVAAGERLHRTMFMGPFRTAALYGEIDDDVEGLPLELTWVSMSDAAKQTLQKHKCGSSAVGMVSPEGGYSDRLLLCMTVAAAYQIHKDPTEEKAAELHGLPYDDPEALPSSVYLAGIDLLLSVLDEHIKKLPKEDVCFDAETFALPVVASLNHKLRSSLEAATEKLQSVGDAYLNALEEKKAADKAEEL